MENQQPLLAYVLAQLHRRRGTWPTISKAMRPTAWQSYYSWLQKLAQGRIPDPSVNSIQELADHFRGIKRKVTRSVKAGEAALHQVGRR